MATSRYQVPSIPAGDAGTGPYFSSDTHNDGVQTVHKDKIVICDASGNIVDTLTTTPAGTERALVTRNIPSGTQNVADGGGTLTVDAPVGTPLYARLSDGSAALVGQKVMGSSLPVALASDQAAVPVNTLPLSVAQATGNLTATQATPGTPVAGGTVGGATDYAQARNVHITVSGTYGANTIVLFEASDDGGTQWYRVGMQREDSGTPESQATLAANTNYSWAGYIGGFNRFRVRCSTFVSGSVAVRITPTADAVDPVIGAISRTPTRNQKVFIATNVAYAGTTEALTSLTPVTDGVAAAAATAFTVTTGKTFRIQTISLAFYNGAATALIANALLRANTAGAVTTTSQTLWQYRLSFTAAVGHSVYHVAEFPDGLELTPGTSWGISNVFSALSAGSFINAVVVGYEY